MTLSPSPSGNAAGRFMALGAAAGGMMLYGAAPAYAQEGHDHAAPHDHATGHDHPAPAHGAPADHPAAAGAAHEGAAHEGAAHERGHDAKMDWELVGYQTSNFVLFLLLVIVAGRRPIMDALGNRANIVRRDLDESARAKGEAQKEYHEIEEKLAGLERRIEDMKAGATRDAEAEGVRIRERAEADAVRIRETATRTVREEVLRARNEIRKEVVEQAAGLAREIVKSSFQAEDQARFQAEFLAALDKPAGGAA